MTVTYTYEVATCRGFGTFLKVLYRWRGSIYKLVWLDLVVFLLIYYFLNLIYRFLLTGENKKTFEGIVNYCNYHGNVIPLSFVLGFYVTVVMNRWWSQYTTIPWPDSIAVFVSATIHGQDERGRLMRRTIVRYVCLCLTMVLTMISPRVKKRFPTLNNFVDAGLLLENEKTILDNLNDKFPKPSKHWLPIVWAASIVTRARKEGRIRDDFAVKTIIDELNKFRGQAGLLLSYDTISVPLVYTQVVTIAVYSYFITSALGSQWVEHKRNSSANEATYISDIDLYFPIFATLEFFFYMGWLKVAESLINPFGEDDDDFEVNWLIDRDLQVSYMIVDEMHHEHPELIKDQYWDQVFPAELPYTIAMENQREDHPEPSTARVAVPVRQRSMTTVAPSAVKIDEMAPSNTVSYKFAPPEQLQMNDDAASGIHFIVSRGSKRGKKDDRNSMGSSNSMASLQQTPITRANSVTSMLKRLFSKEDQRQPSTPISTQTDGTSRFMISSSNASLNKPAAVTGGSMKIAKDVIEEVDEQTTITSMRGARPENRPTAMSIFAQGPPPPSEPVDVPRNGNHIDTRLSSSAPAEWGEGGRGGRGERSPAAASFHTQPSFSLPGDSSERDRPRLDSDVGPSLSAAGSQTLMDEVDGNEEADSEDFERLRNAREQHRRDKYLQKLLARSISAQQQTGSNDIVDNDILLLELLSQSNILMKDNKEDSPRDATT